MTDPQVRQSVRWTNWRTTYEQHMTSPWSARDNRAAVRQAESTARIWKAAGGDAGSLANASARQHFTTVDARAAEGEALGPGRVLDGPPESVELKKARLNAQRDLGALKAHSTTRSLGAFTF
jgi:hypothetical protein